MTQFTNERLYKGSDLAKMDWQGAKINFNHLNEKYKKVKQLLEITGFGLTEADEVNGIMTVAQKLEKLFPCFDMMDTIFGKNLKTNTSSNLFISSLTINDSVASVDFLSENDPLVKSTPPTPTPNTVLDEHMESVRVHIEESDPTQHDTNHATPNDTHSPPVSDTVFPHQPKRSFVGVDSIPHSSSDTRKPSSSKSKNKL